MQTFESIRSAESSVYMMIDSGTICSLHNCHVEPCLVGPSYLGEYCCPKKDCKHVIFTCLVRYSSARGRPAAQCLCHSSIGGFACVALRCSTALSLISRQHCYQPPLTDVSHASQPTLTARRRYATSSSGTACSPGCLPGSPDCYHLAQKCFSFLLATPVSMAEARMGLADCTSR